MTHPTEHARGDEAPAQLQCHVLLHVRSHHHHTAQHTQRGAKRQPRRLPQRVILRRGARNHQPPGQPIRRQPKDAGDAAQPGGTALPVGVGKGQVLEQPHQAIAPMQRQVQPRRSRRGGGRLVGVHQHQERHDREGSALLDVDDGGQPQWTPTTAQVKQQVLVEPLQRRGPTRWFLGIGYGSGGHGRLGAVSNAPHHSGSNPPRPPEFPVYRKSTSGKCLEIRRNALIISTR